MFFFRIEQRGFALCTCEASFVGLPSFLILASWHLFVGLKGNQCKPMQKTPKQIRHHTIPRPPQPDPRCSSRGIADWMSEAPEVAAAAPLLPPADGAPGAGPGLRGGAAGERLAALAGARGNSGIRGLGRWIPRRSWSRFFFLGVAFEEAPSSEVPKKKEGPKRKTTGKKHKHTHTHIRRGVVGVVGSHEWSITCCCWFSAGNEGMTPKVNASWFPSSGMFRFIPKPITPLEGLAHPLDSHHQPPPSCRRFSPGASLNFDREPPQEWDRTTLAMSAKVNSQPRPPTGAASAR